jgi:succinyl-CoA synthetase beta subunit
MLSRRYAAANEIIQRALCSERQPTESEAKALLNCIGIGSPEFVVCRSVEAIASQIERLRAPFVAKIVSRSIRHKTEVGGVVLPLKDAEAVLRACNEISSRVRLARPDATIDGFLIEEYRPAFPEWLLAGRLDRALGPVVSFGMGGVHTELVRIIEHKLAPLRPQDVDSLIDATPLRRVLEGYRGQPAFDRQVARDAIVSISDFICAPEFEKHVSEIEINPISISANGACALDALLILRGLTV